MLNGLAVPAAAPATLFPPPGAPANANGAAPATLFPPLGAPGAANAGAPAAANLPPAAGFAPAANANPFQPITFPTMNIPTLFPLPATLAPLNPGLGVG
ncbi:unnamed protein product [Gongylonema pulchrum]|uniref:PPE-SVP domain-containing protein n=1 Tax=Gongylonema pulchrum TaxID=637853 RepID=A0A183D3R9_9BILA|nr:unnamed protein product [Gongylonema pulchrum]